ncbi:MAG TPA: DUF4214 domain-containing protein [Pirellulales bacterium]|nr:DUF4214 domain-containing protein [Pirellulales bacterium]
MFRVFSGITASGVIARQNAAATSPRRPRRVDRRLRCCRLEECERRLLLTFHLWKIDQVFSSADGKAQFIELHDPANGEDHTAGHFISSNEHSFTFPANLSTDATADKHFLIATASYAALPGAATPDYVVPDNFFNPAGDAFDYADVDAFSFTAGQLPTDGAKSLFRDVNSGNLSTGQNSETNLAGQTASVSVGAAHANLAPTLDAIADPAPILLNSGQQTVNLSGISAGAGETQHLTITAVSDNAALVPNPSVNYASPNSTGSLTYTPVPGAQGTATITVTVKDDGGTANGGVDTTVRTFKVRVAPLNHAPTIDPIADPPTLLEGASQPTVVNLTGITAGPGDTQSITVTAASDNPALVGNPQIVYSSPSATGSLSFTPQPGFFGTAAITVTVKDDGGTAGGGVDTTTRVFHVTVTHVNQPPTIDPVPDPPPILPGSGPQTISLTGIGGGPNETQNVTITASSSNPALIPDPQVNYSSPNATGTLVYAPVAGAKGTATITVTLKDDGGTANGGNDTKVLTFNVTVGLTAEQFYAQRLIEDVLGREPTNADIQLFSGQLQGGTSRADVAGSILNSPESLKRLVGSLYQQLLGRAADDAGIGHWVQQLSAGGDESAVAAGIAASDEFFNRAGGDNTSFVEALYHDVLGRAGESSGVAFWEKLLSQGVSRGTVAQGFAASHEFHGLLVDDPAALAANLQGWYQNYFRRAADDAGRAFFVNQLDAGAPAGKVELQFLTSDEYFNGTG